MLDHEIVNLTNTIMGVLREHESQITHTSSKDQDELMQTLVKDGIELFFKNQIAVIWTVEDVQSVAKGEGIVMTDDEANEILDLMLGDHDANVGFNWDSIRYTVLHYKD
jgi:hypothetical protein